VDTLTSVSIDLMGTTRTHEAARLGRRELARNRLVDLSLSCRGDIDLAVYEAGDVVYAQIDGKSQGGKIVSVDGLTLTVDRDLTEFATGGDAVIVQVHASMSEVQSVEYKGAVLSSARTITVPTAWTIAPAVGDPFLFGPSTIDDDQFEVTDLALDEHLHAEMSLVKYAPALDDLDDLAPGVTVSESAIQTIYHQAGVVTPVTPAESVDQIAQDVPATFATDNYRFYNTAGVLVGWEPYKDSAAVSLGFVRYQGVLYYPVADSVGTADTYIYWDPAATGVFSHSSDPAALAGMRLMAINHAGTVYEKGGLLVGKDGLIVQLDDVIDGTVYKKMTAAERLRLAAMATPDEIVTWNDEIVCYDGNLVTHV